MAYVYILFYVIVKEADMRLSLVCSDVLIRLEAHFYLQFTAEPNFRTQGRRLCRGYPSIGEPRIQAGVNPRRSCVSSQQAD